MKNPIKYLFTVMYRWAYNMNLDSSPEWSAFVGVSVMLGVNLLSIYGYLVYYSHFSTYKLLDTIDGRISFVLGVLTFSYTYCQFIFESKFESIRKHRLFKDGKVWQSLAVWAYIVLSYYALYLFRNPNAAH